MENLFEKVNSLWENGETQKKLEIGQEIKAADTKASKRLNIITAVSCIVMGALGFFAFRLSLLGAALFAFIAYVSSAFFNFSTKKKILIAYLKFYREQIPVIFNEEIEKIDEPDTEAPLDLLYPNTKQHWTVCYKEYNSFIGFVRISNEFGENASGMTIISGSDNQSGKIYKGCFSSISDECDDCLKTVGSPSREAVEFAEILDKYFETFAMVFAEGMSLLFVPSAQDFMSGRVSDKDDLNFKNFARQFAYFNTVKAFENLDKDFLSENLALFETDLQEDKNN